MTLEVDIEHHFGAFGLAAAFVSAGRLTGLFGPSGSGKTTLIRAIAGLLRPAKGRVAVDGTLLSDSSEGLFLPPRRRRVGVVFQEGRLFPHLTVHQNLLFGRFFAPRRDRYGDPAAVIERLGIGHLLQRRPGSLSGGETQRVAIGRALLASPRLLLMDEPLASLDQARKDEILPLLEAVRDEFGIPIVYVSHSVAEVARLATTVVVLAQGRVAAVGPPGEVLSRPDLLQGEESAEAGSLLDATILAHEDAHGLTVLRARAGELRIPRVHLPVGARLRVRVRARDVLLALQPPTGLSALNVVAGRVASVTPLAGPLVAVVLDCSGDALVAHVTRKSAQDLRLAPGLPVHAVVKSVAFDPRTLGRAERA